MLGNIANVFTKKDKTGHATLSLPHSRKVRGYEIRRLPLGKYMAALQQLQELPKQAMDALFPGMETGDILAKLTKIDADMLGELAMRAFSALPKQAATLVSALTEIPEDDLLNDPAIGLDGLMEIVNAWIEENNIENFFKAARELSAKIKTQAANGSSKG